MYVMKSLFFFAGESLSWNISDWEEGPVMEEPQ